MYLQVTAVPPEMVEWERDFELSLSRLDKHSVFQLGRASRDWT